MMVHFTCLEGHVWTGFGVTEKDGSVSISPATFCPYCSCPPIKKVALPNG